MDDNTRSLIEGLGKRFIQRRDVKAWQHPDGAWTPDRTPITVKDFIDHLEGRKTLGHYMMDPADDKCRYFAFDIDIIGKERFNGPHGDCVEEKFHEHPWQYKGQQYDLREEWLKEDSPFKEHLTIQLRCMAEGLAIRANKVTGRPVAIATSGGKGLHVYCFTGPLPGEAQRTFAMTTLEELRCFEPSKGHNFFKHSDGEYKALEIEIFPKQDSLEGKDLGNLMKLPLGIHRKTGIRSEFITCKVGYNRLVSSDPLVALSGDLPWE